MTTWNRGTCYTGDSSEDCILCERRLLNGETCYTKWVDDLDVSDEITISFCLYACLGCAHKLEWRLPDCPKGA